jgi:hypothetical protein
MTGSEDAEKEITTDVSSEGHQTNASEAMKDSGEVEREIATDGDPTSRR